MYGGERSGAESNSCAGRHEGDGPFSAADDEAGGQQQNYHHRGQEDAPLLQANHAEPQGSRGTDFSVHRLLPRPLAFTTQPLQPPPANSHTITHSAGANSTGHVEIPGESYQVEPPQRWVGYGNPYQYPQIPSYQQGPGLVGVRRLAPNHTYSPYPMPPSYASTPQPHPFPEPPSTPSHHHDTGAAVTSPVVPSPRPTNANSLHFYHPANAGLYTLCQAAMMTSNTESYSSYQPPPLDDQSPSLGIAHPSRPPPPYLHYYPAALPFSSDPLQPQTSPVSPHPPNYPVQLERTQTHIPPEPHTGPAFVTGHMPPDTCVVRSSGQDCSSTHVRQMMPHESEQSVGEEGSVFGNQSHPTTSAGLTEQQDQPTYSMNRQTLAPTENDTAMETTDQSSSFMDHIPIVNSSIVQDGEQPGPSYVQLPNNNTNPEFVEDQHQVEEGGLAIVTDASPPDSPLPGYPNSRRPKRTRTAFTLAQQDKLELAYHSNPYPDSFYRQKVALDIGVPEDRIQVWFQNRRARGKKQVRTGSVSQRSKCREQRLKIHLASIARQTALLNMAQGFGMAAVQSASFTQSEYQQQLHPPPGQSGELSATVSSPNTSQVPTPYLAQPKSEEVSATEPSSTTTTSTATTSKNTSLPFSSATQLKPPPAYNHSVGSSTICYFPQPAPSTGVQPITPAPHSGVESDARIQQPPTGTPAMYIFPPPPHGALHNHPQAPTTAFANHPIIHPYPPAPSFPYPYSSVPPHPLSLPPLLPPSTAGSSSGSSSSPSPDDIIIITGMQGAPSNHSSIGPSHSSISPDQE